MEDIDQLLGLIALLPPWAVHLLAYSAMLSLVLVAVKWVAVRIAPAETWPAWVRALFAVLDVLAANSSTVLKLAQLGTTKRQLTEASSRVVALSSPDPLEVAMPWSESSPPPPEPPPLPPKGGAR